MAYRTVLVQADQTPDAAARMRLALGLAQSCQAHLTGVACTGVSRFASGDAAMQLPLVARQWDHWRQLARSALVSLDTLSREAGLAAPTLRLLETDPEDGLMQLAPYHDLLVLSAASPEHAAPGVLRDLPQHLLLHTGRPLLLVPSAMAAENTPRLPFLHPLLAWDGSAHAARAISTALPLLKKAAAVTLLMLNPPAADPGHAVEAGADMALMLARHGVRVEVMREYTTVDIGDALLCVAAELCCDLLVMGGYGHRRGREAVLGGVTRSVMADMTLPLLITH